MEQELLGTNALETPDCSNILSKLHIDVCVCLDWAVVLPKLQSFVITSGKAASVYWQLQLLKQGGVRVGWRERKRRERWMDVKMKEQS